MKYIFLLLLFPLLTFGQNPFRLSVEIENPTEEKIILTIYRNWVELPEDFELFLDANNKVEFDYSIQKMAYLDINYGLNGILFQIIEPNDSLHIHFDALDFNNSFETSGQGSSKWKYYSKHRAQFENVQDWERDIYANLNANKEDYLKEVKDLELAELKLLNSWQDVVSKDFYDLRKADILGRMKQYELDFYLSNDLLGNIFDKIERVELNPEMQNQSFYYGLFVEAQLNAYVQNLNSERERSNFDDYVIIKYCYEKNWFSKPVAERIMASKITGYLLLDAYTVDNRAIVKDFVSFSENKEYNDFIQSQLDFLQGRDMGMPAPSFELIDVNGKKLSLKSLKGSNVLMVFWSSWCGPCMEDLSYLPIVASYFKKNNKLSIVSFAVDSPEDFAGVVSKCKESGKCVRIDPSSSLMKAYGVSSIPTFLLLDKKGNWLEDKLIAPSLDEGRGLIKQLAELLN